MEKRKNIDDKTVAIIIPCFNEEDFIGSCIDSLLMNGYPSELMDIIIVDGLSTDRTRNIVEQYQYNNRCVRMLDNPGAVKSKSLNLGIRSSSSDVVIRIDAHAIYERNYIQKLINSLYDNNATSIGGVRENMPRSNTLVAKGIAYALSNPFAVGNAWYNIGCKEPMKVDILFLFCVKRELFDEIGYFDERLIRGQDREFNMRIQQHGGSLLLVPDIQSTYFSRDTLCEFARWAYEGGMTPVLISRITKRSLLSLRNLVPLFFVCIVFTLFCFTFIFQYDKFLLVVLAATYFLPAIYFSFRVVSKERSLVYLFVMPMIFLFYHLLYGIGTMSAMVMLLSKEGK